MTTFAISAADVKAARRRLDGHAALTPLLSSPLLDEKTGARVFVKAEPLQITGSFKFRGAFNRISQIPADRKGGGVVAYSSGNHAQAVAFAARAFGMHATIIMPDDAPKLKIDNTRGYGAEVVLYDRFNGDREAIGQKLAAERGAIIVPPYDDPDVMAGQGTIGYEIVEQMEAMGAGKPDLLVCCAGGGGLMSGIATAMHDASPATVLYSAEPEHFDDTRRSLEAGDWRKNTNEHRSICDAIVTPMPGKLTFPINKALLAGGLAVSDTDAAEAVAYAAKVLKLVVEPGGAVALAAVLSAKVDVAGKTVAVICSGGNIDPGFLARIIAADGLPA
jgi:threonine dehydratase